MKPPNRNASPKNKRSSCPISIGLEALGDAWSLLIIRDLMFKGRKTFREFQEGGEGIASNILTDRLQRLESLKIISKAKDVGDARKFNYQLTAAGIDLAPTLIELIIWSAKYFDTAAPANVIDAMTHQRKKFLSDVRKNWEKSTAT